MQHPKYAYAQPVIFIIKKLLITCFWKNYMLINHFTS